MKTSRPNSLFVFSALAGSFLLGSLSTFMLSRYEPGAAANQPGQSFATQITHSTSGEATVAFTHREHALGGDRR